MTTITELARLAEDYENVSKHGSRTEIEEARRAYKLAVSNPQTILGLVRELAAMKAELAECYKSFDERAQELQEILLRLRIDASQPEVRESLRAAIDSGMFDGIGD